MLSPRRKSRLPDLLDRIREELNARLDELRPRVDEHGRLEAAMHALASVRLGPTSTASASAPVKTTKARAQKMPPAKRRKRAPRGANRQAVLRAASERPGATSAELAGVSGVEPNTLSGLLGRLVKAGELQTRALPTGRTGYALAGPPPVQPGGTGSADAEDSADADTTPPAPRNMT